MKQRQYRHLHLKPAPTRAAVKREASGKSSLPPKPAEMSWRDYLVLLLHIGAELEHCLMVEYLYAAYSLGGDQVPKDARSQQMIRRWRDLILSVAREEMGHLLSVQNLLCLLGGPVTFDRQDFPWDTVFYLTHSYRLARDDEHPAQPGPRGAVLHKVFGEMYNLKTIAGILVDLPLGRRGSAKRAGPPFEMPYTLELPLQDVDCWRLHQDNLKSSVHLCELLLSKESGRRRPAPSSGEDYLTALRELDRQSLEWIDQVLTGLARNRETKS